jgi:hypothetical protein
MVVLVEVLLVMIHKMEPEPVQEQVDKDFLEEMQEEATTQVVVVVLEEQELVAHLCQMVAQEYNIVQSALIIGVAVAVALVTLVILETAVLVVAELVLVLLVELVDWA